MEAQYMHQSTGWPSSGMRRLWGRKGTKAGWMEYAAPETNRGQQRGVRSSVGQVLILVVALLVREPYQTLTTYPWGTLGE